MSSEITVGIIGGGLAGILVAHACVEQGLEIAWILDDGDPLRGSGVPTGLCHPFPGRSLQVHPLLNQAVDTSTQMFSIWKKRYPKLIRETSMVRPLTGKGGERLWASYERKYMDEAKNIPSWLDISYFPETSENTFKCDRKHGNLVYSPAYAVDLAELLSEERRFFAVQHVEKRPDRFQYTDRWHIWNHMNQEEVWKADIVVLCLGRGMNTMFPNLRLGEYGGEILLCELSENFDELYSGNGCHIGRHHSGTYVFGATRWIEKRKPLLKESQKNLEEEIGTFLPHVKKHKENSIWRGYRTVYHRDRLPISGRIPTLPQMYTCCALGSKGLLWGALSARYCIQEIKNNHHTSNEEYLTYLSTQRLEKERWTWKEEFFRDL
jgi:glycine/D-amino acid oxidase-like deaminating enzyme